MGTPDAKALTTWDLLYCTPVVVLDPPTRSYKLLNL